MNSNYKTSPKKLAEYCKGRICQNQCKYNQICWFNFRLERPDNVYLTGKKSDDYKKLKYMVKMINDGVENDVNKVIEYDLKR